MADRIDASLLPALKPHRPRAKAYAEIAAKMQETLTRLQPYVSGTIPRASTWRDDVEGAQEETIAAEEALLAGNATEEARNIRAAQERMRNGAYGLCVKCGTEILLERLKALPTTPNCVKCAQKAENAGTVEPARQSFARLAEMEEAGQEDGPSNDPDMETDSERPTRSQKPGKPRKA